MKERVEQKSIGPKSRMLNDIRECTASVKYYYWTEYSNEGLIKDEQFSGSCKDVIEALDKAEASRTRNHPKSTEIYVKDLTISTSADILTPKNDGFEDRRYSCFFKAGTDWRAISYKKAVDAIEKEMNRLKF